MDRLKFWRYLRYILFSLVLANIVWQIGFSPGFSDFRTEDPLRYLAIVTSILLVLILFSVLLALAWKSAAHRMNAPVIEAALARGYRESDLIPLLSLRSPASTVFMGGITSGAVLAWDREKFELFVQPPGSKKPYPAMSGKRAGSQIELQRIAPKHPAFGVYWGFQITFRHVVPNHEDQGSAWNFVPFTRNYRVMRKTSVQELIAELEQAPTYFANPTASHGSGL